MNRRYNLNCHDCAATYQCATHNDRGSRYTTRDCPSLGHSLIYKSGNGCDMEARAGGVRSVHFKGPYSQSSLKYTTLYMNERGKSSKEHMVYGNIGFLAYRKG